MPARSAHGAALRALTVLLLVLAASPLPGGAQPGSEQPVATDRPRVGLVLSGGGARGAAHVGVLQELEARRVPVDAIAGTSMGAVVGGLYAAGYSADELAEILAGIDWAATFRTSPARSDTPFRRREDGRSFVNSIQFGVGADGFAVPPGVVQSQQLGQLLRRLTFPTLAVGDFDDLPIPFRAVAADIETGAAVVLAEGPLPQAILASLAVPGFFPPVEIGDRLLVDGGIANNVPVDVARAMGVDRLIVVDLSAQLRSREEISSAADVLGQMVDLLIARGVQEQLETLRIGRDVLIRPAMDGIDFLGFDQSAEALPRGRAAARAVVARLDELSLTPTAWQAHLEARAARRQAPRPIAAVEIGDTGTLPRAAIASRLTIAPGQPIDLDALDRDLRRIYGLGYYEGIEVGVRDLNGRRTLIIDPRARSTGPNYLQVGLQLEDDFGAGAEFSVGARLTATGLDDQGSELRAEAQVGTRARLSVEYYSPLGESLTWFWAPRLALSSEPRALFLGGVRVADFNLNRAEAGIDFGRTLGDCCEARVGLQRITGFASLETGDPLALGGDQYEFEESSVRLLIRGDTLDDPAFPRSGWVGSAELLSGASLAGGEQDFARLLLEGSAVGSIGDDTLQVGGALGLAAGGLPIERGFTLGGFLNLSGRDRDELLGGQLLFGRLVYYHRLTDAPALPFEAVLYAGGSFEVGKVFGTIDQFQAPGLEFAGSAFLGADTPIGPVFLGYGQAEGGRTSLSVFIGRTF